MQGFEVPDGRVPRGTSASSRASAARALGTGAKTTSAAGPSCARWQAREVVPGSQANSLSRTATPGEGATRGSTASGACAEDGRGSDDHGFIVAGDIQYKRFWQLLQATQVLPWLHANKHACLW